MSFIKHNSIFLLPILSGILLILAYPPNNVWFLVFIALIPLFLFLTSEKIDSKKAFIGGIVCGIVFMGWLFVWLLATYPFDWLGAIGAKKEAVFVLLIILYIIQTIFLGLFFGGFSWTIKRFLSGSNRLYLILIIPVFWVIFEYIRAWGFGILYFSKESLLGPHWTFGNLAYAFYNRPSLIQIADLGGIYLISFLVVLVNTGLFLLLKEWKRLNFSQIIILLLILVLIGIGWTGYGIYRLKKADFDKATDKCEYKSCEIGIVAVQTNFLSGTGLNPYYSREAVFRELLKLFRNFKQERKNDALAQNIDIVVFPEGFGLFSFAGSKTVARYLLKDFWEPGQVFLENQKIIDESKGIKSRLFYYDLEKESPLGYHDKRLLVPNGDFLPYLTRALMAVYSFRDSFQQRFYQKGELVEPIKTSKGAIGGTICSSILSPEIHRQMTKKEAELLVVVSSDAPFHGNRNLLVQNLAMSKFRAVENRRYFIQATNMGYSFILDPKGRVISGEFEKGNKLIFNQILLLKKKTVYNKFGDWIVFFSLIIGLFSLFWQSKSNQ